MLKPYKADIKTTFFLTILEFKINLLNSAAKGQTYDCKVHRC